MGTESHEKWGAVLIVGGAGRLGYFVAQQLQLQPECGSIISISRSGKRGLHQCDGVDYRAADLRDHVALGNVIRDIRPETIINVAAPAHANTLTPRSEFEEVVVKAQDVLIELAREVGTKYMICTTSANVAEGCEHIQIDETAPLWPEDSSAFAYWVQRAKAEKILLAADSSVLQTISLRLPMIIGERDYAFVPSMLKSMKDGSTKVQIGNDTGLLATVSASDAARAHILALRKLMKPGNDIHGEAFYITGRTPLSFWGMARIVWKEAGWKQEKPPFVIPGWLARMIAMVSETMMRPFGKEPQLSTHVLKFMFNTWTYDGRKAQDRLGYAPQDDTEDQLRRSVRWHVAHESS